MADLACVYNGYLPGVGFGSSLGSPFLPNGPVLGPNLMGSPNGPYASAPWTASGLTETTGQTDPIGGSTASLLTDTAVSTIHQVTQSYTIVVGQKYLATVYFKPGTYTGGIAIGGSYGAFTQAINVSQLGVATVAYGTPTNLVVTSVGGFFKVTFNFVQPASGAGFFAFGFGAGFNIYTGTLQNQTFWGMDLQTST